MKKFILLFIILLLFLSVTMFKVRENQVAIVKKHNGQLIANYTGQHFFIPFLEKVYFIQLFKSYRVVEVPYITNKKPYILKLLIEFKINDAINYFKLMDKNGKVIFLENFDNKIKKLVMKSLHKNINELNNSKILFDNIPLSDMGIFINCIALSSINNLEHETIEYKLESLYDVSEKLKLNLYR